MDKIPCSKCPSPAVWMYMPDSKYTSEEDRYFCEEHIHRGCSCNMDENGVLAKDEQGRDLPCCEYWFSEEGYNDDENAPLLPGAVFVDFP